jgi:hypothetical protein
MIRRKNDVWFGLHRKTVMVSKVGIGPVMGGLYADNSIFRALGMFFATKISERTAHIVRYAQENPITKRHVLPSSD